MGHYANDAGTVIMANNAFLDLVKSIPTRKTSKILHIENKSTVPVQYETLGSAGFDIPNNETEQVILQPLGFVHIHTGLYIDHSYDYLPTIIDGVTLYPEIQIRSRSGHSRKFQVFVLNSPGTIDQDYTHEIGVFLFNLGKDPIIINPGDRVAQGVHSFIAKAGSVGQSASLRAGGWGSTG